MKGPILEFQVSEWPRFQGKTKCCNRTIRQQLGPLPTMADRLPCWSLEVKLAGKDAKTFLWSTKMAEEWNTIVQEIDEFRFLSSEVPYLICEDCALKLAKKFDSVFVIGKFPSVEFENGKVKNMDDFLNEIEYKKGIGLRLSETSIKLGKNPKGDFRK